MDVTSGYVCRKSEGLSGRVLRKLPFLAHALYIQVRPSPWLALPWATCSLVCGGMAWEEVAALVSLMAPRRSEGSRQVLAGHLRWQNGDLRVPLAVCAQVGRARMATLPCLPTGPHRHHRGLPPGPVPGSGQAVRREEEALILRCIWASCLRAL